MIAVATIGVSIMYLKQMGEWREEFANPFISHQHTEFKPIEVDNTSNFSFGLSVVRTIKNYSIL